jgi:hypothetical protein
MPDWKHAQWSTEKPSARDWTAIVAFYADLVQDNDVFGSMAELATRIAQSPYAAAGLSALTSMHDLLLGPSKNILSNPHLRISWNCEQQVFRFDYDDGSAAPWTRTASRDEAFAVVERFVVKRVRWYRGAQGVEQD